MVAIAIGISSTSMCALLAVAFVSTPSCGAISKHAVQAGRTLRPGVAIAMRAFRATTVEAVLCALGAILSASSARPVGADPGDTVVPAVALKAGEAVIAAVIHADVGIRRFQAAGQTGCTVGEAGVAMGFTAIELPDADVANATFVRALCVVVADPVIRHNVRIVGSTAAAMVGKAVATAALRVIVAQRIERSVGPAGIGFTIVGG